MELWQPCKKFFGWGVGLCGWLLLVVVVVGRCWIRGSLEQVYYLRCEWFTPKVLKVSGSPPKLVR